MRTDDAPAEAELFTDEAPPVPLLLIELRALEAEPEIDDRAEEAEPEMEDAPEEAEPPAPPMTVKRVVLPVVLPAELVKALVVTAEEEPPDPDPACNVVSMGESA